MTGSTWVGAAAACERLRVRPQTLYAYVSRGLLHPRRTGRRSEFAVAELDELAARGRRRARSGRLEVLIDTAVTMLDPAGRLCFRGVDVDAIAGSWSFERTAELLWSGVDDGEPAAWPDCDGVPVEGVRPVDRVRLAAATLAATAPDADRQLDVAATIGRRAIPAIVASLPLVGEPPGDGRSIAARLWPRLSPLPATSARVLALNAALVLLADHELAASTVAARVAASVWSPPLDVVVAAMGAHAGVLHGGAGRFIEDDLRQRGDTDAGVGHPIYRDGDPRADVLLPIVRASCRAPAWRPIGAALERAPRRNVDFALAALTVTARMPAGSAEAIFAIARVAGWLAHAGEEYRNPFRFRPRASYVGAPPVAARLS